MAMAQISSSVSGSFRGQCQLRCPTEAANCLWSHPRSRLHARHSRSGHGDKVDYIFAAPYPGWTLPAILGLVWPELTLLNQCVHLSSPVLVIVNASILMLDDTTQANASMAKKDQKEVPKDRSTDSFFFEEHG